MGCFSDRKLLGKLMKLPENFAKMTLFFDRAAKVNVNRGVSQRTLTVSGKLLPPNPPKIA